MRGYAPTSLPSDGSYHVGALMDDALRVLDAAGPTGRDVLIGHGWGAIAGAGLAAMPDSPFTQGRHHVCADERGVPALRPGSAVCAPCRQTAAAVAA
jgi:pimeloyl-ACP methyl ester carboxylesterase